MPGCDWIFFLENDCLQEDDARHNSVSLYTEGVFRARGDLSCHLARISHAHFPSRVSLFDVCVWTFLSLLLYINCPSYFFLLRRAAYSSSLSFLSLPSLIIFFFFSPPFNSSSCVCFSRSPTTMTTTMTMTTTTHVLSFSLT